MVFANLIFPLTAGFLTTITVLILFHRENLRPRRRRYWIVAVFLLLAAWSSPSSVGAADFVACDVPNDGVIDIVILYDARMFNAKALRYAPNYDPIPEFAFRPVKQWLSKYTAFMIDRNRATVTICLHGMTTSQGGLECTLLKSISEIQTPENLAVVKKFLNKKYYEAELGDVKKYKGATVLGGLGQLASTLVPGKNSEVDPRADVPNVVFAHINDPSNQDPERLSRTAATLAARGIFVVFIVFGPFGVPLGDNPMHKFTQELRRHIHNKHFGVVNANEPYNFDAYVRVCKVHKNCGDYHSVSQCHSPTNLLRAKTCVHEMSGGDGSPTCPRRVIDACGDPNLCPIACNALAWSEWICTGSCGQPKSYRERPYKAGTHPYASEYCLFVETKDCPPEMVRGGGRMTCPETVTVPPTTSTLTPPPPPPSSMTTVGPLLFWTSQDMTMILVIGGVTLLILLCLVGFVYMVRSKKKEDEFEELEYEQIMKTLARAKQAGGGRPFAPGGGSAYGGGSASAGRSGKAPYPGPGAGYSGYGAQSPSGYGRGAGTGQNGYGGGRTGQTGYGGAGTGQSGYGAGRTGQSGYGGGGGTGQSGYGAGGTGQSGYGGGGAGGGGGGGTGQSGYGAGGTGQSGYGGGGAGGGGGGQSSYGGRGTGQSGYGRGGGGGGGTGQSGYSNTGTGAYLRR